MIAVQRWYVLQFIFNLSGERNNVECIEAVGHQYPEQFSVSCLAYAPPERSLRQPYTNARQSGDAGGVPGRR